MASDLGPDSVVDGLVLSLDVANIRSFPGGRQWFDLSGTTKSGELVNGVSYSVPTEGDGKLFYLMVDNSSGHPSTTQGLTDFFTNGTNRARGLHTGIVSWAGQGQTLRWGGTAGGYPPYHTRADNYGWQANGFIYLPTDGSYNFLIDGDDACDFFINNELCSYWYGGHGFGSGATGTTKTFYRGWYSFLVRMEEQGGGDGVSVAWQKPGDGGYSTIPGNAYSTNIPSPAANSSFTLDGVDDYIRNISNTGITHGTSNFSYFAWVRLQGKPSLGTIFENGSWTSCLLLRYETDGITVYSMGSYWGKFSFNPTLNTWNHLGFIRNGNVIEFYVNGVYQTNMAFTANISPSSNIFIGTSQHATGQVFNGNIALAQIYTRALSATEVLQNFNAQRDRFGI